MSDTYGVRSYGDPYFTALQENLAFMDVPNAPQENDPGPSTANLRVVLSLEALPVKLASDDESHVVASYADYSLISDMLWIAITPSGRVQAKVMDGVLIESAPGLLVPDGKRRTFDFVTVFDAGSGINDHLRIYDGPSIADRILYEKTNTPAARSRIVPSGLGQFMLFNGILGKTRCKCTIYEALFVSMNDAASNPIQNVYNFDEKRGTRLNSTVLTPEVVNPNAANYGLTLMFNPIGGWWGPASEKPISAAFRWFHKTQWTRQTRTKTVWARST